METRGAVAQWDPGVDELTVWNTSQNPHIARFLLCVTTGIPENKIRVISRDVGGGFGSKIPFYPGDALTVFAARETGRPVKWIETRRENYVATIHGRDQVIDVEMAAQTRRHDHGPDASRTTPTWARISRLRRQACRPGSSR